MRHTELRGRCDPFGIGQSNRHCGCRRRRCGVNAEEVLSNFAIGINAVGLNFVGLCHESLCQLIQVGLGRLDDLAEDILKTGNLATAGIGQSLSQTIRIEHQTGCAGILGVHANGHRIAFAIDHHALAAGCAQADRDDAVG